MLLTYLHTQLLKAAIPSIYFVRSGKSFVSKISETLRRLQSLKVGLEIFLSQNVFLRLRRSAKHWSLANLIRQLKQTELEEAAKWWLDIIFWRSRRSALRWSFFLLISELKKTELEEASKSDNWDVNFFADLENQQCFVLMPLFLR